MKPLHRIEGHTHMLNDGQPIMKYLMALLLFVSSYTQASGFDHQHARLTTLLADVVEIRGHQSRVNYELLIERRGELDAYLEQLSSITRKEFDEFSESQQLAFLINTYNGFQLKQVIDNYPIKSIKDVGSFFSSPWSKEFFSLFDEPASLDHVEHSLIRKLFKEPRIHFAVNCASISCPPLANEAYQAGKLEAQLESAAFNFLQDKQANYLDGETAYVSKIFSWYEEDFTEGVVAFVARYWSSLPVDLNEVDVKYTAYNWSLNKS